MSEENGRKTIGKKVRFEVFKRDSFTCQYCGEKAPNVVLHIDHIRPVADGGTNEILNLVTSCVACNSGKGARLLGDDSIVERQRLQIEELQERRAQLEMMLQWRDELQSINSDAVDMIAQRIGDRTGWLPNEDGKADIRRWLKRYSVSEIMRACDEAFDAYLVYENDQATQGSWARAFSRIVAMADVGRQEQEKPYIRRLLYIQGIIRRRSKATRYNCVEYLEHVHLCGMSLDDMERRAKGLRTIEDFEGPIDAWLDSIGRPY